MLHQPDNAAGKMPGRRRSSHQIANAGVVRLGVGHQAFGRGCRAAVWAALLVGALLARNSSGVDRDWPSVGGDKGCMRYSALSGINRRNVANLQVAWIYHAAG